MSNYITNFGMHAFANAAQALKRSYEISPQEIDFLLDSILASLPENGEITNDLKIGFNGKTIKFEDALKMISPHMERMRLQSIASFETYFQKDTSVEGLTRDFNSGDGKARRIMRQIGVFPVEAMNVRAELANPDLLRANAAKNTEQAVVYLQSVFGLAMLSMDKGPHLPPLTPEAVVQHFKRHVPQVDQLARQIVAGIRKAPGPTRVN